MPLVSIVIPAYNVAALIRGALDSALGQTMTDFEVIVVNDGSPDATQLEQTLAPYRDRIEYVVQDNRGPSAARNAGIRRARGEFVAFLDADDTLLPFFLEEHLARAAVDRLADVFYGDLIVFGDVPEAGRTMMERNPSVGRVTFSSLITHACNPALCSLVRRTTILAHGLFDESLRRSEDFDLWLRMAHAGVQFNYTRRVVARYCVRAGGLTSDVVSMIASERAVLAKCSRTMDLNRDEHDLLIATETRLGGFQRLQEAKRAFFAEDYATARLALIEAEAVFRSRKLRLAIFLIRVTPRLLRRAALLLKRGQHVRR